MKTRKIYHSALILIGILLAGMNAFATRYSIDVRDFEFSPSSITTVRVGDTIHWEWKNGIHTTTSTTIPEGAPMWDQPINIEFQTYNYVPTILGTYNYKCTPHLSMGMVGSFIVTAAAGVPDGSSPVSITLYPNPASDKLTILAKGDGKSRIEKVRVLDASGKVVKEYTFAGGNGNQEMDLSLEGLPTGLLILEFRQSTGIVASRRIIRK